MLHNFIGEQRGVQGFARCILNKLNFLKKLNLLKIEVGATSNLNKQAIRDPLGSLLEGKGAEETSQLVCLRLSQAY